MPRRLASPPELLRGEWMDKSKISRDQLEGTGSGRSARPRTSYWCPRAQPRTIKIKHPEKGPLVNLGRVTQQCSRTSTAPIITAA